MSHDKRDPERPSPERFTALLQSVLELSPDERDRWIDESSAGNVEIRQQLQELLRQARAETVYLHPAGRAAPQAESANRAAASEEGGASLVAGQQLGRYEVLDLLGAGGMGNVYRALDPSLGREVAIKALARAFHGDSGSLRRFEREARVLATLSHPNIATIYGFERLNGAPYLVLERVDGETLAHRLSRGSMPVDDAIAVALQIVSGLEEAHAKGVIHRDLKPSNVMLTPDGRAKLVDFGLAKTTIARPEQEGSPGPITATGAILGTARYMSPEQVKGDEVDARTDVWAFGCVLYEMLTARAAFAGRSISEVVAAVLRDEPEWVALPADTPASVARLLRRCLRRDPRTRLQHIGDARLELEEAKFESRDTAGQSNRVQHLPLLIVLLAASTALGAWLLLRSPSTQSVTPAARLSVELPAHMTLPGEFSAPFAVAPTGSGLVIEAIDRGTQRLYVRELEDPALRALPGTEGARQPFFSADGRWIGFFANRKLSKMPVGGGPIMQLADVGGNPRGATWAPTGTIVVAPTQTSGLVRVADDGGRPAPLTTLDKARGEYSHRWPDMLPDEWVLFTVGLEDAPFDEARIEAVSLETGERRVVLTGAGFARYVPPNQLLFVRGGHLHAVEFDRERLAVRGTPQVILDAVRYDWRNGGSHLAASSSGVLVYGPGTPTPSEYYVSWIDREGRLKRMVDTPRPFRDLRASPDGRRMAAAIGTSTESDLWTVDANGTLSRLTFGVSPHRPVWAADGSGITVGAEKNGRWRLLMVPAEGKGEPTVLFESSNRLYPNAWSGDGRFLIFQESRPATGWDLSFLRVDADGRTVDHPQALATTPFHESTAAISPDGRWVAYESDELDGIVQVYVRSFPSGAHKVRASTGGARWPAWDTHGGLYYWQTGENRLMVVRTREKGGQLLVDTPEAVWRTDADRAGLRRVVISVAGARYDVDASGTRFLVLEQANGASAPELSQPIIVLGWGKLARRQWPSLFQLAHHSIVAGHFPIDE